MQRLYQELTRAEAAEGLSKLLLRTDWPGYAGIYPGVIGRVVDQEIDVSQAPAFKAPGLLLGACDSVPIATSFQKLKRAPNSPEKDFGTITPEPVMKLVGCVNVAERIFPW